MPQMLDNENLLAALETPLLGGRKPSKSHCNLQWRRRNLGKYFHRLILGFFSF